MLYRRFRGDGLYLQFSVVFYSLKLPVGHRSAGNCTYDMKNQLLYLLLAVLVSCVSEPHDRTCAFSHEDFRETKELQAQILQLDSVYNFSKVYCVGDSFLLANNNDPAQKCKVQLYSLDGKKRLAGFAQLGHSKSEVVSNDIHYIHSGSDTFYVEDAVQGRYWVCSLDSLKNDKSCVSRSFNYSKDVISVYPLDSTYIGLDFWYAGVPAYDNGIGSPLASYSYQDEVAKHRSRKHDCFVANVAGGVVFRNPGNGDVWVAYSHDNTISIYGKDMVLRQELKGPCAPERKFRTLEVKGKQYVFFERKCYVDCYYDVACTDKYVYLLYRNVNAEPLPRKPKPVEVLQFTWNGDPVARYRLDRYAYSISVDSDGRTLYATCVDPTTSEPQFVKFAL